MKTLLKKCLAVFMVVVLTLTAAPLGGLVGLELPPLFDFEAEAATISSYSQGDIIEFGWYPQNEVTDSDIIAKLNSAGGEWISYNYYSGTGTWNDGKMTAGDYMRYKDVMYGSEKYRGIVFDNYRPYYTGETCSPSDSYQDDNGYTCGRVYWFKYSPLEWRVLDPTTGLVMAETIIDAQAYNNFILYSGTDEYDQRAYWGDSKEKYYANNYAESSIRKWLNEDFYNTAFSTEQQEILEYTTLDNSAYSDSCSAYDSATTIDKIYLLSYNDTFNTNYGFISSTDKRAKSTAYAMSQGVYIEFDYGTSHWWLRTPGSNSNNVCDVYCDGDVSIYSGNFITLGIRPALNFNLTSKIFQSDVQDTGIENEPTTPENSEIIASGNCGDNLTWFLYENGLLKISGTGAMDNYLSSSDAPWYDYSSSITSVDVGQGVTSIGNYAFSYCENLTSATINDGVSVIGESAFYNCYNFASVTMPDSLTVISNRAFFCCRGLTNIDIPDSVTKIGDSVFYNCNKITKINLPKKLSSFGKDVFAYCSSLESISIDSSNSYFSSQNGILLNKEKTELISCPAGKTEITIPDSVTSIAAYAFYSCTKLTDIVILDSVVTIGDMAFVRCDSLATLKIGKGLQKIGDSLFCDEWSSGMDKKACNALRSIVVDSGNKYFSSDENGVLFNKDKTLLIKYPASSRVKRYVVPQATTVIADYAFFICSDLEYLTLGSSVNKLGYCAIYDCDALISVDLAAFTNNDFDIELNSAAEYDYNSDVASKAIASCAKLESVTLPDGISTLGSYAISYNPKLTSISLPLGLRQIGEKAFYYDTSLSNLIIPEGVTTIGWYAFGECGSLEYIHIPVSVTDISSKIISNSSTYICSTTADCYAKTYADENGIKFKLCNGHSIEKPPVDEPTTKVPSIDEQPTTEPTTQHKHTPQKVTVPASCTINGMEYTVCAECGSPIGEPTIIPAGHKWSDLETVTESTCKAEGKRVKKCSACGATEEEIIDKKEHTSGEWEIVKEATCNATGEKFQKCTACGDKLNTETIPKKEHIHGEWEIIKESTDIVKGLKIKKCTVCGDTVEEEELPLLDLSDFDFELYYDSERQETCAILIDYTDPFDPYMIKKLVIPSTYQGYPVTWIGDNAISCGATEITIPDTVKFIGNGAFAHCNNLRSIVVPDSVKIIGERAFYFCTYLERITIGNSVISIGAEAFYWCLNLGGVTIPDSVNSIGSMAFYGCSSLVRADIGNGVKDINSSTFMNCYNLTSVTLGNNVSSIGAGAFHNCKDLISINLPNSLTSIGDGAFVSTALKNVVIPYGVTTIGTSAFAGCRNLESIVIPDSVSELGEYYTFSGCDKLTSIKLPDGLTTIGFGTFDGCTNLTNITIPSTVKDIYGETRLAHAAFADCNNLSEVYFEGSETEWNSIDIGKGNDCFENANIHFGNTKVTDSDEESISFGQSTFSLNEIIYGTPGFESNAVLVYNSKDYDISSLKVTSNNSDVVQVLSVEKKSEDGNQKTAVVRLKFTGRGNALITVESPTKTEIFDVVVTWKYSESETEYSIGTLSDNNKIVYIEGSEIYFKEVLYDGKIYKIPSYSDCFKNIDKCLGKRVAVGIADGNIIWIMPVDEIRPLIKAVGYFEGSGTSTLTIDYNSKKLWGKYNKDNIALNVTVSSYGIQGNAPQKILNLLKAEGHFDVQITDIYVVSDSPMFTNDGKTQYIYTLKTPVLLEYGKSVKISSTDFELDKSSKYRPTDEVQSKICNLGCSTSYNWKSKSCNSQVVNSVITINNTNYKKPKTASESAEAAADCLDSYDTSVVSIGASQTLNEILSRDQQKQIENAILTSCAMATISEEKLEETLVDKLGKEVLGDLYQKLNPTENKSTSHKAIVNTAKYGKVSIQFDVSFTEISNSMIVGSINYTILGDDSKLSQAVASKINVYQKSGSCGQIYAANIGDFVSYSQDTALSILKDQYNSAWGKDAEKAADLIFSDAVKEILKRTKKSVSGITWEMMTNPTIKTYANCPVDIWVYDSHDNLVGEIINNEIVFVADENVELAVEGETKIIMLRNDDYKIVYESTSEGTMSVVIEEYANGSGLISRYSYEDIPLSIDLNYIQNIDGDIVSESDYNLVSNTNKVYEATKTESGFHTHTPVDNGEVYKQQTCNEDGEILHLCDICNEWYIEIIPQTTHKDKDDNDECDYCGEKLLKIEILNPSTSTINYGETLIVHVDLGGVALPEGCFLLWTIEGTGFSSSLSDDCLTCKLTSVENGTATIKVTLVNLNGELILDSENNEISDSMQFTSKAGFWQKFISFFKNLFGISRIILQSI